MNALSGGARRAGGRPRWTAARGALLVAACACASPGQAAEPVLDEGAIARFVESARRTSRIPGLALVIVRGNEEVYAAAFGGHDARPITPDTPFLIGSVTKTLTALAVARLADAGRLGFEDPVRRHLPSFALADEGSSRAITLRHLLTHTSGLRQWSGHDQRAQRAAAFSHIAVAREPGSAFEYSSLNYVILGQVLEAVAGTPYPTLLRRHVFEPLDMRASFTSLDASRRHELVRGHRYLFGLTIPSVEAPPPAPLVPAGYAASSARDLGRSLSLLLGDGTFRERRILSRETLRELLRPWNGDRTGPAMAWGVGRTRIGHAGNTATFSARLAVLPEERYGIVLLANVNSGPFRPGTAAVMDGIISILRGGSAPPHRPDELLIKLGLLVLLIVSVGRAAAGVRLWSRRGFPLRWRATPSVLGPLALEAASAAFALFVLPRWIGVPVLVITEYFPDLGLAIVGGVAAGLTGALTRSLVRSHERGTR